MRATRFLPTLACILLLLLLPAGLGPAAVADSFDPKRVEGLEAWYRADAPELQEGAVVSVWPDASGNGHDLVDDGNGRNAVCQALQINELPAVRIDKANSHSVTEPFELGDHTIFVVFRSDEGRCRWVDLVWHHRHPGALELANHLSAELAAQTGAEIEELWLNGDEAGKTLLEGRGFLQSEVPGELVMVARAFDPELDLAALDGRIYLTMADADLV